MNAPSRAEKYELWRKKFQNPQTKSLAAEDRDMRDMRNSHEVQFATRQLGKPGASLLAG